MKDMKRLVKFIVVIMVVIFGSCKKDSEELEPKPLSSDGVVLKATFEKEGYVNRLNDVINDSLYIAWTPSWDSGGLEEANDSTRFVYIPLIPKLFNKLTNKEVEKSSITGYGKYIVFRIADSYTLYLAQFTSPDFRSHPVSLYNFTGFAIYEDLKTGKKTVQQYLKGVGVKNGRILRELIL